VKTDQTIKVDIMRYQEKTTDKQIGRRLAKRRKELELSQQGLADKLLISQRALSSYERGTRSIPVFLLPKLAEALDISLESLLGVNCTPLDGRTRPARILKRLQKVQHFTAEDQRVVFSVIDSLTEKYAPNVG